MFKVRHKETGEIRIAYGFVGVRICFYDGGSGNWYYAPIDDYEPVEE